MPNLCCYRLKISGKVQGVWYRKSTQLEAQKRGLTGWVQNENDGSVTCVVQGPKAAVDALAAWCHQGPEHARVDAVEMEDVAPIVAETFEVRR